MITVLIAINQRDPIFEFGTSKAADNPCRVSKATAKRWKKIMADFEEVQTEMRVAVTPSDPDE